MNKEKIYRMPVDSSCGKNIVVLNYDISKAEAEKDLNDFLLQLEENGLLN